MQLLGKKESLRSHSDLSNGKDAVKLYNKDKKVNSKGEFASVNRRP
jgi:hypothetical protein